VSDEALFDLVTGGTPVADPVSNAVPFFHVIANFLEKEEGRVDHAYQDSRGFWTIGVGRLIDGRKGGRLDIKTHTAGIQDWPAWQAVKDDPVRAAALVSMAFQLGVGGLAEFRTSLGLIAAKQWQAASDSLLKSLWAKQTPGRALRVAEMIATGEMQ
jgi:lysozyme